MNRLELSLHYQKAIIFTDYAVDLDSIEIHNSFATISLINRMMNLGFIPSEDLTKVLKNSLIDLAKFYSEVLPELQKIVGDDVEHKPMYPNFPEQVINLDYSDLVFNAVAHYGTCGEWLPEFESYMREFKLEPNIKYKEIDITTDDELIENINSLLYSPDSLTSFDKDAIQWLISNNLLDYKNTDKIVFAETRCIVMAELLKTSQVDNFNETINNMTDILRVCTYLSKGDVSLSKNTKFKNFKRSERRFLTNSLEIFWDDETAYRHKNKWVKLLHSLHVGDYSDKVWNSAKKLRENIHIETFNSNVEKCLKTNDVFGAINLLKQRPSEFARRLDHLMRLSNNQIDIIDSFFKVIEKVPTKIIIQLIGHFNYRTTERKSVVTPKGVMANAVLITQKGELSKTITAYILDKLNQTLFSRFYNLDALTSPDGKVWIDPSLHKCPVPSGMRSISDGLVVLPRGTTLDFGDDSTIRMFVHWKGQRVDVDLSATFHDEDFKTIGNVSYHNLRDAKMNAYHSGDITSAPNGASEFLDIDISQAAKNARYVTLNVLSYSGEKFKNIEDCFVGWMGRSEPNSNEIYDAKTVKQCLNLVNENKYVCPVLFDLVERKVITVDVTKNYEYSYGGNNVESNRAGIEDILYSVVHPRKMSLYELFHIHVNARTKGLVYNKDEAEFTFGIEDCNINVSDWVKIQTDWME